MLRSKTNLRIAVSLIEMLIVVAIIGVLIALLIPAIQGVRNSAKRVQNQNNIKQIMLAMHDYIAQNNGNLPNPSGFPGEICSMATGATGYSYGGSYPSNGFYQSWWGCSGTSLVSKQTNTWNAAQSKWDTTFVYINANTRLDWTEGTELFLLLPYMEYKGVWDSSYGPMSTGAIYKTGNPGSWSCPAGHQTCYGGGWGCYCDTALVWTPKSLTDANKATVSTANYGWQAGRNPVLVKTFLGYGDPTADFPGMLAPLSYPLMKKFTGTIENYNTAYQAVITEAYAGCNTANPFSSWTNPLGNFGTYNSWAASQLINVDFNPIPMTPGYGYAAGGAGVGSASKTIWTGIKTPDTQCEIDAAADPYQYTQSANCTCSAVAADPNYPSGLADLYNQPPQCNSSQTQWDAFWSYGSMMLDPVNSNARSSNWGHVSSTTPDYTQTYPSACKPNGWGYQYNECHVGEWFYTWTYPTSNSNFWLDHPPAFSKMQALCSTGEAMSMVPGSINVGFLDGSVRSINKDVSSAAWAALLVGQMPMDDANNW